MDNGTSHFKISPEKNQKNSGCSDRNHVIELPRSFNLFRKVSFKSGYFWRYATSAHYV